MSWRLLAKDRLYGRTSGKQLRFQMNLENRPDKSDIYESLASRPMEYDLNEDYYRHYSTKYNPPSMNTCEVWAENRAANADRSIASPSINIDSMRAAYGHQKAAGDRGDVIRGGIAGGTVGAGIGYIAGKIGPEMYHPGIAGILDVAVPHLPKKLAVGAGIFGAVTGAIGGLVSKKQDKYMTKFQSMGELPMDSFIKQAKEDSVDSVIENIKRLTLL